MGGICRKAEQLLDPWGRPFSYRQHGAYDLYRSVLTKSRAAAAKTPTSKDDWQQISIGIPNWLPAPTRGLRPL
jgi:hypothetical protein